MMASVGSDDEGYVKVNGCKPGMIGQKLSASVIDYLDELSSRGKLSLEDLDERAIDALEQISSEEAHAVLNKLVESNLDHVSNKSAYLCSIIRTIRKNPQYQKRTSSNKVGPDELKLTEILLRTGYSLDVTSGQRKYGGPPPGWDGPPPGKSCEVYCGNIPRDMYEDDLIPLFEKCGKLWDFRLMMDGSMSGLNRSYAFVTFISSGDAINAIEQLNNVEIAPGKLLTVKASVSNTRLFVGNIPKSKSKDEIAEEFEKYGNGLLEVIIYSSNVENGKKQNRGFCFLDYKTHQCASQAKKYISSGRMRVWGCDIIVDWADPQEEPDQETMGKVKILYCRNLSASVDEKIVEQTFQRFGKVERVKKIKDYAFVHFDKREEALEAMKHMHGEELCGSNLDISLAKPPTDKKKKEEMLRRREQRMMDSMAKCMAFSPDSDYFAYGYGNGGVKSYGDCLGGRFSEGGTVPWGDGYYRGRRGGIDYSAKWRDNIYDGQLESNGGYMKANVHERGVFDFQGDCPYVGLGEGLKEPVKWHARSERSQIGNKRRGNFRRH